MRVMDWLALIFCGAWLGLIGLFLVAAVIDFYRALGRPRK